MKISKLVLSTIIFIIMIFTFGCADAKPESLYEFELCDYKNLSIGEDTYDVTIEDLQASMSLYANAIDDRYEDYTFLNDSIVKKHYDCETVSEFQSYVLKEIVTHRIIENIMDRVLKSSKVLVKDEVEFNEYYNKRLANIEKMAEEEGYDLDSFIEEHFSISKSELREEEYTYFVTMIILNEILNREDVYISQEELNNKRNEIAQEMECSVEETYQSVLDEDIVYIIAEDMMYEMIVQWYQLSIDEAILFVDTKLRQHRIYPKIRIAK